MAASVCTVQIGRSRAEPALAVGRHDVADDVGAPGT